MEGDITPVNLKKALVDTEYAIYGVQFVPYFQYENWTQYNESKYGNLSSII